MNYYHFNIGDYAGKTRHLSWDEDMAYRRLLDAYYASEAPLPADRSKIYRLVGAQSKKQKNSVDAVLEEFFDECADGWRNSRCDEEIAKAAEKKGKASQSARTRWEAEKALRDALASQSVGNADAMRTHSEGNAPSPSPSPNIRGDEKEPARDADKAFEGTLRKAAGWENHPNPKLAITGEIQALVDSGADLELDVLPVIRAKAPKCRHPNWRFFVEDIAEQRDRRMAAGSLKTSPTPAAGNTHGSHRAPPARDTFAVLEQSLAEQRARAAGEAGRGSEGSEDDRHQIPRIRQGTA